MCRPTGSYFWESDLKRGIIFKPFVERGTIFQMHESFKILSAILTVERVLKMCLFFRTGCPFGCKSLLKRGPHLEAWAAHTHPKPTRVPPPPRGPRVPVSGYLPQADSYDQLCLVQSRALKRMGGETSACLLCDAWCGVRLGRERSTRKKSKMAAKSGVGDKHLILSLDEDSSDESCEVSHWWKKPKLPR